MGNQIAPASSLWECFRHALAEERGKLIVALYDLPLPDLERLVEAAQLIDSEGVEALELRERNKCSCGWMRDLECPTHGRQARIEGQRA